MWGREGGARGREHTDTAPFLSDSTRPTRRDPGPVSFLHVNELFGHLLREEKLHRCGRPILGHTITAICIPPEAGLAQECALQLCGGKRSLGRKKWGGGPISPQSVHPKLDDTLPVLWESESGNNSYSGLLKRGEGEKAQEEEWGGALRVWELPLLVLWSPRSLGETNFSPRVNQNQITQECGRTGLSFQVPLSLRI